MNTVAAVIFDVDGTLVDSERDGHRVAFNAAFDEDGLPDRWDVDTYGWLLRIAGGRQRLTYWFEHTGRPRAEAEELAARLHRRKTDIFAQLIDDGQVRPRPGVEPLLDVLDAAGVALHVATTGTRAWVEPLLDRVFGPRFATVVTGTEVPHLKPDPAVYRKVLDDTGAPPRRTVAVEDSANGVRAAVAAGLCCVAAFNAYTCADDLTGAALITDGLDDPELAAWFRERLPDRTTTSGAGVADRNGS